MDGIDSASALGAVAARMASQGIQFAARYYSYHPAKNLTASEATALLRAGLAIVSVWEALGDHYATFTAAQGEKDATEAMRLARACQQPGLSAIYFAVDFDASADQIAGGIADYFTAAGRVIKGQFTVGAYGSGLCLHMLGDRGLARYLWLGGAMGWRGSRGFTGWHIRQQIAPGDDLGLGLGYDRDTAVDDDFGAWRLALAPARPAADDPVVAAVKGLQRALADGGFYAGAVDGIWGPKSEAAFGAWEAAQ